MTTYEKDGYKYTTYSMSWEESFDIETIKTINTIPIYKKRDEIVVIPHLFHIFRDTIGFRKFLEEYSNELESLFMNSIFAIEELDIHMTIDNQKLFSNFCKYMYLKTKNNL